MRIALAGFGQEGKASYEYWNRDGNELTIADERKSVDGLPESVSTILGSDAFSQLTDFDLIIRSPSVNPKKLPYADKVWSATNEFFEKCPAPIIGVTGTKGKGTTSSLIASILAAAGKKVHLVGNIGVPALSKLMDITEDSIVVYELSSFQLWDCKKSPHIAVVLMIEPDHLDVHDDLNDYVQAKANIARHVGWHDVVYYQPSSELSRSVANEYRELSQAEAIPYGVKAEGSVYHEGGYFKKDGMILAPTSALKIPGRHNVENACAALAAVLNFTDDLSVLEAGLAAFEGLPHRLKFVAERRGVKFYDDSIATTPGSAMAAIRSFQETKVIILGGKDKGANYTDLIRLCYDTNTMIVPIGENGQKIYDLAFDVQIHCANVQRSMKEAVMTALSMSMDGDVVILSPAAASFDMFKSYADRGDQFIAAVNEL